MADSHKEVDEGLFHARQMLEPVRRIMTELARLDQLLPTLREMQDGDGSAASHYAKQVALQGVKGADENEKLANAKVIYDEMNFALGNSTELRQFLSIVG